MSTAIDLASNSMSTASEEVSNPQYFIPRSRNPPFFTASLKESQKGLNSLCFHL